MFTKEILAERIISLRKKLGLSQQQVADKIGVCRPTYSDMERAKRDITAVEIKKLADLFQVSLDQLLMEQRAKKRKKPVANKDIHFCSNKLKTVLLYLLARCGGKPHVGETVIHSLLYMIDFDHYEQYGQSVTGLTYVHGQFAPLPLETQYEAVIQEMQESDALNTFFQDACSKRQKRYVALQTYQFGILSEEEKESIDHVIRRLSDMNAMQISSYARLDTPWKDTSIDEVIPYELAFEREVPFSKNNHRMEVSTLKEEKREDGK